MAGHSHTATGPVKSVLATEAEIDKICQNAAQQIQAKVLAHVQKHPDSAFSGHYLVDLEKSMKELYKLTGNKVAGAFKRNLPKVMKDFYAQAAQDMKTRGTRNAILGKVDERRINDQLNSAFTQVAMRTDKMTFQHIQQLRNISAEVLRTATLTGATRKEVTNQLLSKAQQIPGFKFVANNNVTWDSQVYFKMLARTELMQAGRRSYEDKCAQEGYDIVMLDYSGKCCDACGKWEGKIFSLTGATPGLPTKADLEADGVFHPNCTHSYSALTDYELAEMGYEMRQPGTEGDDLADTAPVQDKQIAHDQHREKQLELEYAERLKRECALVGPDCIPIKGEHSVKQDLLAVNPNYKPGEMAYAYNCQRCVTTYEARRRGLDVTALPTYSGDTWPLGYRYTEAYKDGLKHLVDCSASRGNGARAKVEKQVLGQPDGSRFIVRVGWKSNPRSGHVFIAENQGGVVKFIDPQPHAQARQLDASKYWGNASGKHCWCIRVDNLEFTDKIKEICKAEGKK